MRHAFRHLICGGIVLAMGACPAISRADEKEPLPDKATFIRRVTLDMTGKMPTREEVQAFENDKSPDAYKKLVLRLSGREDAKVHEVETRRAVYPNLNEIALKRLDVMAPIELDVERPSDQEPNANRTLTVTTLNNGMLDQPQANVYALSGLANNGVAYDLAAIAAATDKQASSAYLGVGVDAPGAVVRDQLRLAEGTGLVVNYVDPNGPCKDVLREHDVLQKVGDQLLVNAEQLVTLVRIHKPGETLTLSLIRQAQPMKVEVKLAEKKEDSRRLSSYLSDVTDGVRIAAKFNSQIPITAVVKKSGGVGGWRYTQLSTPNTDKPYGVVLARQTGPVSFADNNSIAVCYGGKTNLITLIDRTNGSILFSGPLPDEKDWKNLPADVQKRLAPWREAIGQLKEKPAQVKPEPAKK